jgi:hypothetical protein
MVEEKPFNHSGLKTADASIINGQGVLHTIIISMNDAAPTAGTITVYDGTAAASGKALFSWTLTTAVFTPFSILLVCPFNDGLYIDFTTTADVNVALTYKGF